MIEYGSMISESPLFLNSEKVEKLEYQEFFLIRKPSLDLDGVVIDSITYITNIFNQDHGTNFLPADMRVFKAVKYWLLSMGCSESYADKKELEYWYSERLLGAPFKPGAIEFLEKLNSAKKPIHPTIVSSRPPNIAEETRELLLDKLPFLDPDKIFIQANREMPGDIYKAFIIGKERVGYHFEDMIPHTKTILDYTNASVGLFSNINGILDRYYDNRIMRFRGQTPFDLPDFNQVMEKFSMTN